MPYTPFHTGPGLAIRVLCAEQPYKESSFTETSSLLKSVLEYHNASDKVTYCFILSLSFISIITVSTAAVL